MNQPQPQKQPEQTGVQPMPTMEPLTQATDLNNLFAQSSATHSLAPVEEEKKSPYALENIPPEKQAQVMQIAQSIDLSKSNDVMLFGTQTQRELSKFSDSVLAEVKMKDSGEAGQILGELMTNVRSMDVKTLEQKDSILAKLPLIKYFYRRAKQEMMQWENMGSYMDKVVHNLDTAKFGLYRDITKLDQMYAKNYEYFENLNVYIAAGEAKLQQFDLEEIAPLREQVESTGDQALTMKLQDMMNLRDRFEKRLHDLKLSRTISLQMAPQIRVIQQNNQILAEKIESAVVNTIPLWKNQVVLAISLNRQANALKAQQDVTKTTNTLLEANSKMLKNSSIEVAKENEKGVVSIESLKIAQQNLIETLDETLRIQTEGKQKRRDAEKELIVMEEQLKEKVLQIAQEEARNAQSY
ncbi:toxic anion resistance family protein (plasmid) [Jeotgalibacillus malaysiensis]|uniref:Toxic anion resistance family protein n=1 Tax=Jeotgalibacillus malaysiensis TaxID=1508404 RepID=A0A0B5ATU8_9BACL|nr:toxic anion resistance protein [Jeotgalibacillus malaysiensis]AJD93645.1 toxic anion resistance family protein [Jeotgalibacillus malaysiensis]